MRIIRKANNIIEGWKNLFFKDEEVEEFAEKRAEICSACPKLSRFPVVHCDICLCFLPAKCRVEDEDCPLNKW